MRQGRYDSLVALALLIGVSVPLWTSELGAQQQEGQPLLVTVLEQQVRSSAVAAYEQNRKNINTVLTNARRPFPFTVLATNDGRYFYLTRELHDLADYERWVQANAEAMEGATPGVPGTIDHNTRWWMLRQPEWSYVPSDPRLESDEIGFVHWDIYFGIGGAATLGMTPEEATAAGIHTPADVAEQLVALYRQRNIRDGFRVYTTYASSHADGGALIVATAARDAKDYYTQVVRNQRLLGEEGLALLASRLATTRKLERIDFSLRRDLSYSGPGQ